MLGLAVIIALILIIAPKKKAAEGALYNPGTYSARIILHNKPVNVSVTVSESEITAIELSDMEETQEVFYPLFKPTMDTLAKEILKKQTTAITPPTNAEYTGRILLDAVNTALLKAVNPDLL